MPLLPRIFAVVLFCLSGCEAVEQGGYVPPGDGVPKGCRPVAQYDAPLAGGIGLSSHLPWGDDPDDVAGREFEVAQWAELGVGVVRRDLYWSNIEPQQGAFEFASADRVVDAADSVGAEPLGLLLYGNDWATEGTDDTMTPPDDPAAFGAYSAAVAERYRGRIRRYEVWNEPNVGMRFWKPVEDPDAYGALLIEAADRVHEVDPDAKVAYGGLFHPDLLVNTPGPEFLQQTFDAHPDLADHLDAVAFHPYRYPFTAPETEEGGQPSLVTDVCGMWDLLAEQGAPDLRLWITEMGWHTARNALVEGVSEADQAAFLARGSLLSLAQGSEMFLWYTFRDSGTDSADQEDMFGLYTHDADPTVDPPAEPKEAAAAFATLTAVLGDHDRIEDRSELFGLDEQTYAYELSGGEGIVVALWTVGEERAVLVPGEGEAEVVEMDGTRADLAAVDGAFELSVGEQPRYLKIP